MQYEGIRYQSNVVWIMLSSCLWSIGESTFNLVSTRDHFLL